MFSLPSAGTNSIINFVPPQIIITVNNFNTIIYFTAFQRTRKVILESNWVLLNNFIEINIQSNTYNTETKIVYEKLHKN